MIHEGEQLKNIVLFSFMGFEDAFRVKQAVQQVSIDDPSLLWGLSALKEMIGTDILAEPDDGFVSVRPKPVSDDQLLPVDDFLEAEKKGEWIINL